VAWIPGWHTHQKWSPIQVLTGLNVALLYLTNAVTTTSNQPLQHGLRSLKRLFLAICTYAIHLSVYLNHDASTSEPYLVKYRRPKSHSNSGRPLHATSDSRC